MQIPSNRMILNLHRRAGDRGVFLTLCQNVLGLSKRMGKDILDDLDDRDHDEEAVTEVIHMINAALRKKGNAYRVLYRDNERHWNKGNRFLVSTR